MPKSLLIVFASIVAFTGCAPKVVSISLPAPAYSVYKRPQAAFTDGEQKLIDRNCPDGLPETRRGFEFGPTRYVFRDEYVLQHVSLWKTSLFVCEGLPPSQLAGPGDRNKSRFKPDPALGNTPKATDADYKGQKGIYDRGHLAPAANHKNTQKDMDETHYLSNVVPQSSAMNEHIWQELEDRVRGWAGKFRDVREITGGFFYDPEEEDPEKADGMVTHLAIGKGVAVPTHMFKIVVATRADGGRQAIAFVMENKKYPTKGPWKFEEYIKPVRWIEDRAGLNFMPLLDPDVAKELETKPGSLQEWE